MRIMFGSGDHVAFFIAIYSRTFTYNNLGRSSNTAYEEALTRMMGSCS